MKNERGATDAEKDTFFSGLYIVKTVETDERFCNLLEALEAILQDSWRRRIHDANMNAPNQIRKLASAACDQMIPHALDFEKYGDPRRANPNVVFTLNLDGSPLINSEGYQQKITFGMFDQNGKNGADWLTKVRKNSVAFWVGKTVSTRSLVVHSSRWSRRSRLYKSFSSCTRARIY